MKKYKLVTKKGEGTFSEVVKAQNIETGTFHAIKCMKESYTSASKVNNLREIQALRRLTPHPNIINLEEVLFDQPTGRLAMVFELMDKNLYDLICGRREHLDNGLITNLAAQLFTALAHIHKRGIFHRDIKPENILVDKSAKLLKLADLGSCRGTNSKQPFTGYIATRWYRAPECLLTDGHYGSEMDVWGAGCVLFELISLYPLFPGSDELDQLNRIHKVVGTPPTDILDKMKLKNSFRSEFHFPPEKGVGIRHFIPHASTDCVSLISRTLVYDYNSRITAKDSLRHPYFGELKLKLADEPKLIPEVSHQHKSRRDENKQVDAIRKNSKDVSSDRERKPKRTTVPHHTNTKGKMQNTRQRYKKVKPTEDRNDQASKPFRRHKAPPSNIKLPSLNSSRHTKTNTTNRRNEGSKNPPKVTNPRRKKFANVKSSGYGTAYKPREPLHRMHSSSPASSSKTDSWSRHGRQITKKPSRLPPIRNNA